MKQPRQRIAEKKEKGGDTFLVAAAAGGTRKRREGQRGRQQLAAVSWQEKASPEKQVGKAGPASAQVGLCSGKLPIVQSREGWR